MLQQAIKTIRIFLPSTGSVTHQQIIDAVEQVMYIFQTIQIWIKLY
jgi:hypothetical protein